MPWFIITLYRLLGGIIARLQDRSSGRCSWLTITTVMSGTAFYASVEGWGLVDALYFSVITLTTVSYGDLAPTTPASKLFTIVYTLLGVGVLLGFVNKLALSVERRRGAIAETEGMDALEPPERG